MIVITGVSGQLGRAVVDRLVERIGTHDVVATTRDPDAAADLKAAGIAVRGADFADPASLRTAFEGADQLLLVSANKLGEEALRLHRNAIEAAQHAGVSRILYTSHMGARLSSPFAPADQHAGTEAELAAGGLAFTALRHGFYAESCLHMVGDGLRSGELRTPEDGPVSWTARDDLADGDAAILASPGRYDGVTPPLTAAAAVTMAELAALASEVTGRNVRHVTISDAVWREERIAAGTPPMYADMLLGTFLAARNGDFRATDNALADLLGRQPLTIQDVLRSKLAER